VLAVTTPIFGKNARLSGEYKRFFQFLLTILQKKKTAK
jgi:hypothetical protein